MQDETALKWLITFNWHICKQFCYWLYRHIAVFSAQQQLCNFITFFCNRDLQLLWQEALETQFQVSCNRREKTWDFRKNCLQNDLFRALILFQEGMRKCKKSHGFFFEHYKTSIICWKLYHMAKIYVIEKWQRPIEKLQIKKSKINSAKSIGKDTENAAIEASSNISWSCTNFSMIPRFFRRNIPLCIFF